MFDMTFLLPEFTVPNCCVPPRETVQSRIYVQCSSSRSNVRSKQQVSPSSTIAFSIYFSPLLIVSSSLTISWCYSLSAGRWEGVCLNFFLSLVIAWDGEFTIMILPSLCINTRPSHSVIRAYYILHTMNRRLVYFPVDPSSLFKVMRNPRWVLTSNL